SCRWVSLATLFVLRQTLFDIPLDELDQAALRQPLGAPNGVLDRFDGRASVADHTDSVHAQQGSAAELRVVHPATDASQRTGQEEIGEPSETRTCDLLQQKLFDGLGHPLRDLQRDVSDASVAHDHVHPSVEDVSTLYVPDEIQRTGFKELQGFLGELVALRVFFPATQLPDA